MADWVGRLREITADADDDQLLTKTQAAKMLNVTPRTVYMWGLRGKIPRVVLGGKTIRYRLGDVRKLIREGL